MKASYLCCNRITKVMNLPCYIRDVRYRSGEERVKRRTSYIYEEHFVIMYIGTYDENRCLINHFFWRGMVWLLWGGVDGHVTHHVLRYGVPYLVTSRPILIFKNMGNSLLSISSGDTGMPTRLQCIPFHVRVSQMYRKETKPFIKIVVFLILLISILLYTASFEK